MLHSHLASGNNLKLMFLTMSEYQFFFTQLFRAFECNYQNNYLMSDLENNFNIKEIINFFFYKPIMCLTVSISFKHMLRKFL